MTDSVTMHKIHPAIPLCGLRTAPEIDGVFRETQFHNLIPLKMEGKEGLGFTSPFYKVLHLLKSICIKIL